MNKFLRRILFAISLGAPLAPACADDTHVASVEDAWSAALVQYADGRYTEAFGNFFWAAIRDHAQAQEEQ